MSAFFFIILLKLSFCLLLKESESCSGMLYKLKKSMSTSRKWK